MRFPVVLLSEVHPLGVALIDPAEQAFRWHKLLKPAEVAQWRGGRGRADQLMALLTARASDQGKTLLLRDWSHLDYLGVPFVEPAFLSRSSQLLGARFHLRRFATARHPADQWMSQQRLDLLRGRVDPAAYLAAAARSPSWRPRSASPATRTSPPTRTPSWHESVSGWGWSSTRHSTTRYRSYANITGDEATLGERPIGEIRPAVRRPLDPALRDTFAANPDYAHACRLLGYDPA